MFWQLPSIAWIEIHLLHWSPFALLSVFNHTIMFASRWVDPTMSLWTLLCALGHSHAEYKNRPYLTVAVPTKLQVLSKMSWWAASSVQGPEPAAEKQPCIIPPPTFQFCQPEPWEPRLDWHSTEYVYPSPQCSGSVLYLSSRHLAWCSDDVKFMVYTVNLQSLKLVHSYSYTPQKLRLVELLWFLNVYTRQQ